MNKKLLSRQRKIKKIRATIKKLNAVRLTVHRTPKHIYSQVISADGMVIASASSLERSVRENQEVQQVPGKIAVAKLVGKLIAERSKDLVSLVAFDRSGFKYHGRIKALAESAREYGLNF